MKLIERSAFEGEPALRAELFEQLEVKHGRGQRQCSVAAEMLLVIELDDEPVERVIPTARCAPWLDLDATELRIEVPHPVLGRLRESWPSRRPSLRTGTRWKISSTEGFLTPTRSARRASVN